MSPKELIGVSACLIGIRCRYDGKCKTEPAVTKYLSKRKFLAVCPEVLGGLDVPRTKAELKGGDGIAVFNGDARVVDRDCIDVTAEFVGGSKVAIDKLEKLGSIRVILKEKSPSCGIHKTYIDGELVPGMGVFAAILKWRGFKLVSDEELAEQQNGEADSE
jgi:uncharacterized protein YbbK (DUF523 family)